MLLTHPLDPPAVGAPPPGLQVEYEFPANATISQDLKDLIRRILVANPNQRLSLRQIQEHPWFRHVGLAWSCRGACVRWWCIGGDVGGWVHQLASLNELRTPSAAGSWLMKLTDNFSQFSQLGLAYH